MPRRHGLAAALLSLTRAMQHVHTRCVAAEVHAGLFRPAFADKAGLTQSTSSTSPRLAALLKGLCACRRQDCRLHRCCPLHFLHPLLCGSLCMATNTSAIGAWLCAPAAAMAGRAAGSCPGCLSFSEGLCKHLQVNGARIGSTTSGRCVQVPFITSFKLCMQLALSGPWLKDVCHFCRPDQAAGQ